MSEMILSIIVISHNQKDELGRCVESILAQSIPFPYELILSDDRSNDGTFALAQEYAQKYPHIIQAIQCNSDECNPANNSQRSGWNRCNGYKLVSGKYIAHVDADDYFRAGSKVYQHQVELLEQHTECSLCMQNVWILQEGSSLETGRSWFVPDKMQEGAILTAKEFISNDYFILNQAFVARRNPTIDPVALYGKRYVDSVITYHHLQFGSVICTDSCDYVYMKHCGAVTTSLNETDRVVLWCLGIYIPLLIPSLTGLFFAANLPHFLKIVQLARRGESLTPASFNSIKDMDAYIYHVFGKSRLSFYDRFKLNCVRLYLVLLIRLKLNSALLLRVLYRLLIHSQIDNNVNFKY